MNYKEIDIKTLSVNPFKMIGDEWMLVTAGTKEKCNTMTASWGGFGVIWGKNVATIYIRPQRYTKEFLDSNDLFSLTFYDKQYKKTLGICGSQSGRDTNKIENAGLNVAFYEGTPYFEEANTVLICKKLYHDEINPGNFEDSSIDNNNYPNKDYHTLYIAEILKVLVRE